MGLNISGIVSLQSALEMGCVRLTTTAGGGTMGGLSRMVENLVKTTNMSYADIVLAVKEQYPDANTSTKSVASVACVMRKKGLEVPYRLRLI